MLLGRFTTGRRVLLAACGVFLASCASRPTPAGSAAEPLAALRRAAADESVVARAVPAPLPDGVDPLLGQVLGAEDPRAHQALSAVIASLAGPEPVLQDLDVNLEALKLYVSGRGKLLDGDAAEAIKDLRAATELDPAASEPWFALAEAQMAQGLRADAVRSFRSSVAGGRGDVRALEFLGRVALERGDLDEAGAFLARACRANPDRADPALASVIGVELARALAPRGYTRAALESLLSVLNNPVQLTSSSRYASELGAVFRRQGDLWREAGDAQCRLGKFAEAAESYRRSSEFPSLDATPLRPRLVFALVRSGRPSQASVELMEDFAARQGRVDDEDLALLRYVAAHGGDAGAIGAALHAMQREQTSPALARSLSLARARLLTGSAGVSALRQHLKAFPSDVGAVVELLNSFTDSASAVSECVSLVRTRPSNAKLIAEGLLRSHHAERLPAPMNTPEAAQLLWTYTAAKQGRAAEALSRVSGIRSSGELGDAAAAAQVEVALDAGDVEAAFAAIGRLESAGTGIQTERLLARTQLLVQQVRLAWEASERVLAAERVPTAERLDDLLLAADIAARMLRAEEAERLLNEAAALDAYDERPPSLLLVLHSAEGAMPDVTKLSRAARTLRQNMPGSRTLRLVRARELMRRQVWGTAEAELRSLVNEDPGDAGPMELLGLIWSERRSDAGLKPEAREWLDQHLRRRPLSPLLLAAMTSIESASGRSDAAEKNLREALSAGAGPDVSRVLERLLRQTPSRAAEADALARRRLADHRRTVADSIEFAELSLGWKDAENAVAILRGGLLPNFDLTAEQARRALLIAGRCVALLRGEANMGKPLADAAAVIERCLPTIPGAPAELHQVRVEAVAAIPGVAFERIFEAIRAWLDQYPQAANAPYLAGIRGLVQAGQSDRVPDFVSRAAERGLNDPGVLAFWFESVIRSGSAESGRHLLDTLHASGSLRDVLKRMSPNADLNAPRDLRAEAAYMLGVLFAQLKRDADATAMYEYALKHDPEHAWACNNLGYWLADRGEQIERASTLLETAYNAKPDEAPIIDSLGWLRYKQGIIVDVLDVGTREVSRRGALALLNEAAATLQGRGDNTIQDHLGDAQWLAGQRAEAIASWRRAMAISQQVQALARQRVGEDEAEPESSELDECRAIIESTQKKVEAAEAGKPVRVAPQYANENPQPVGPERNP